jgi:dTDP-4-dehydrorhamnose 3,5-epimerase-like enzyme
VVPIVTQVPISNDSDSNNQNKNSETFYFAQPIANGFQVVDSKPKVIMKLYTTSQKNVFLGTKGVINGVLISKENQWFFEYYDNGKLVSEPINLKF